MINLATIEVAALVFFVLMLLQSEQESEMAKRKLTQKEIMNETMKLEDREPKSNKLDTRILLPEVNLKD